MQGRLHIRPATLVQANEFVARLHRHHKPVRGHRFSLVCTNDNGDVVGAAICGRPVARKTCQYSVIEVTRLVTDGTPNACSALYGACARVAKAMGFASIQTFILDTEPGTSLKASGWICVGVSAGGDWNTPSRGGRRTDQPMSPKTKWRKVLRPEASENLTASSCAGKRQDF